MAEAPIIKTTFEPTAIEPFFTGEAAAVSADGSLLATSYGEDVIVTEVETGRRVVQIKGDTELITAVAISPDGQYVVACSRSQQMRTYTLPEGKLVHSAKAHEAPVIVIDIDATSTLVATGGADGVVQVWDLRGGFSTHAFRGHSGVVSALKIWGERGTSSWRVVSGSDDTQIRVWDLVARKCVRTLDGHESVVRGLAFSDDGAVLVSGGRDKVVCVWDMKTLRLVKTVPVYEAIETVALLERGLLGAPGEQVVATGGERGVVRLWSLETNAELTAAAAKAATAEETSVADVRFIAPSRTLITVLSDQTILVQSLASAELAVLRRLAGRHGEIIDCAYAGPAEEVLALATNSPEVRLVSLADQSTTTLEGHTDIVICIDVTPDGRWLASAGKDNEARVWRWDDDAATFVPHASFAGHVSSVGGVALARRSAPGRAPPFLVTGSQDLTVKRWTVPAEAGSTARAVYTRKAHDKDINAVDVSADNVYFATASQDRTIKVWAVESGETVGILRGHKRGVWTAKFSPSGKQLVSGSGDKSVKVWSLQDHSCLKTFEGHTNSVLKSVFLTGGLQVASAGGDGLVKVWEIKTGECSATLDNHEDKVWSLAVKRDDSVLVSGGGDSVITFWRDVTEAQIATEAAAAAELVEKEQTLANYLHRKDWRNAITLALSLDQPYRLLKLFTAVIAERKEPDSVLGLRAVDAVVAALADDQLERLLSRVRDWNTNARTAPVAQRVLNAILRSYTADRLLAIKNIKPILDAAVPYSERHYARVTELVEQSFVIDYTLRQMDEVMMDV
ncbi:WD40-repeat-containing domain protein [Dipodascopsis tothii]|uniref:WD40-repeat-containing domain protein n=1 Tax=Dipodascopsis tothii TaxID=44089 RepID=UPI0034CF1694